MCLTSKLHPHVMVGMELAVSIPPSISSAVLIAAQSAVWAQQEETVVRTGRNHATLPKHIARDALPTRRTSSDRLESAQLTAARTSENDDGADGSFKGSQARVQDVLHN